MNCSAKSINLLWQGKRIKIGDKDEVWSRVVILPGFQAMPAAGYAYATSTNYECEL
ncbi:MAG: hypothetical protein ACYT04_40740 [Nostoc sp.]